MKPLAVTGLLLIVTCPAMAAPRGGRQLSLREAVELGLRVDPVATSTVIGRDRTRLAVLRSQLDRFSLKVDASVGEQWSAVKTFGDTSSLSPSGGGRGTSSFSATLTLPIFTGFRVTSTVQRAQRLEQAARANAQLTARSVAVDVLRAYWAVRRVELQIEVVQQSLDRLRDAVRVVKARIAAGLAPPVDQNRMETRRQREVARLATLQWTAAEGRAQLAVALGLGGRELHLSEPADVPPPPPASAASVDQLLATATSARGELVFARMQTLAALEQVRIARSAYYPQLTGLMALQYGNTYGVGGLGLSLANDPNPFANTSLGVLFGATLSINLFDTLNTMTAVRDARYVVSQQEQEERRLGRLVEADVRTTHARLLRLYGARAPLLQTIDLARDTRAIIERRYKNGDATILDFLDAEVELLSSALELADSSAAIAQTWGELRAATGRTPGREGGR
jgi:outer membrane protein